MENQNQNQKQNNEWVFIPILKENIYKRTDKYVLFDLDGNASAIVSSKFLRKKESEEYVYLSLPQNFTINCSVRELIGKKWTTTQSYALTSSQLRVAVLQYNKVCQLNKKAQEPTNEVPF